MQKYLQTLIWNEFGANIHTKWGMQIVSMNFQTRSSMSLFTPYIILSLKINLFCDFYYSRKSI